jgi:hypothetical protein
MPKLTQLMDAPSVLALCKQVDLKPAFGEFLDAHTLIRVAPAVYPGELNDITYTSDYSRHVPSLHSKLDGSCSYTGVVKKKKGGSATNVMKLSKGFLGYKFVASILDYK